jgi:hypothetical protein
MLRLADLLESNHRLESRVREIRQHRSEGGGARALPTPIKTASVVEPIMPRLGIRKKTI